MNRQALVRSEKGTYVWQKEPMEVKTWKGSLVKTLRPFEIEWQWNPTEVQELSQSGVALRQHIVQKGILDGIKVISHNSTRKGRRRSKNCDFSLDIKFSDGSKHNLIKLNDISDDMFCKLSTTKSFSIGIKKLFNDGVLVEKLLTDLSLNNTKLVAELVHEGSVCLPLELKLSKFITIDLKRIGFTYNKPKLEFDSKYDVTGAINGLKIDPKFSCQNFVYSNSSQNVIEGDSVEFTSNAWNNFVLKQNISIVNSKISNAGGRILRPVVSFSNETITQFSQKLQIETRDIDIEVNSITASQDNEKSTLLLMLNKSPKNWSSNKLTVSDSEICTKVFNFNRYVGTEINNHLDSLKFSSNQSDLPFETITFHFEKGRLHLQGRGKMPDAPSDDIMNSLDRRRRRTKEQYQHRLQRWRRKKYIVANVKKYIFDNGDPADLAEAARLHAEKQKRKAGETKQSSSRKRRRLNKKTKRKQIPMYRNRIQRKEEE